MLHHYKKNIRATDFTGRYGGEEFMVIFPNTTLSIASKISERIRQIVEDYNFVDGLKITISGGVGQHNNETITQLVHSVENEPLYSKKKREKSDSV